MKFSDLRKNFPEEPAKPAARPEKKYEEKPVERKPDEIPEAAPVEEVKRFKQEAEPPVIEAAVQVPDDMRFSIKKEEKDASARSDLKEMEKEFREKAGVVYSRALSISKETFFALNRPYVEKFSEIDYAVRILYGEMKGNPFFPGMISYLTPSNYLYSHCVNTAIISMGAAIELNMPEEEVLKVGIAAFLHDIGMPDYSELSKLERKLNGNERELVKGHVASGLDKLEKIMDFERGAREITAAVISRHHERVDGSGYPDGLSGDGIDVYSGIVAAADVYEAMTHKRPWREAIEPPKVMKYFVGSMKELFPSRALKGVFSGLSMYPVGSLVSLSTGEIARVTVLNKKSFSRPVVKTLLDGEFNPMEEAYIDLMEYPLTDIEAEVEYSALAVKNPRFFSDFEISNFWVDW